MRLKVILVPVNGVDEAAVPLAMAIRMARAADARVECVHAALDPQASVPYFGEGMTGAMVEDVMNAIAREEEQRGKRAREQVEAACKASGVEMATTTDRPGFAVVYAEQIVREEDLISQQGRLADLIVMPRPTDDDDVEAAVSLQAAITETARPVLMTPPTMPSSLATNVCIAWNGSVQSARAIAEAMPLLLSASQVTILAVADSTAGGPDAHAARRYLAWHGEPANVVGMTPRDRSIGDSILDGCGDRGADLLVMGAYTKSQIRRLIFGGVTRDVLEGATMPVLLVH